MTCILILYFYLDKQVEVFIDEYGKGYIQFENEEKMYFVKENKNEIFETDFKAKMKRQLNINFYQKYGLHRSRDIVFENSKVARYNYSDHNFSNRFSVHFFRLLPGD